MSKDGWFKKSNLVCIDETIICLIILTSQLNYRLT